MNDFILTKLEDTYLDRNILLQTDKGETVKLSSVVGKGFTLALRYTSFSCTPCVDSIVEKIRDFIKTQEGNINVLILGEYRLPQELKAFKRTNRILSNIYNVSNIKLSLEEESLPYIIILDETLKVIETFIPRPELPQLTDLFLEKLKMKSKEKNIIN